MPEHSTQELRLSAGTLRYRDSGPRDAPVLLFVHGFLVDGRLWRKVTPLLDDRFRCVVPDLPLGAHAIAMDDGADLTPKGVAGLLAELMEALDLRDVTVVGNDTGGAVTQVLVTEHPERIARMALTPCDAFESFPPQLFKPLVALASRGPRVVGALVAPFRFARLRRSPLGFGWIAKHGIPDDVTEAWLAPSRRDAGVRRDVVSVSRGIDPAVTLEAARKLASFHRPVLLAWAPEDRLFPVSLAERLQRTLPDARLELVEDAWTFLPEDQPGRLAALLGEFAGSQSAGKVPAGTSPA